MSRRRSTRKKKENPRYPGSSQPWQDQEEEEAEEPPDPDEVPDLRLVAGIEEEDKNHIIENLEHSVTSSDTGFELVADSTPPTPEQDRAPGDGVEWWEEVEQEDIARRLRKLRSASPTLTHDTLAEYQGEGVLLLSLHPCKAVPPNMDHIWLGQ